MKLVVSIAIYACIGLCAYLFLRASPTSPSVRKQVPAASSVASAPSAPGSSGEARAERESLAEHKSAPSSAGGRRYRTGREALESLWGPLSDDEIAKLAEEGIQLDQELILPPWEEVESALRAQLVEMGEEEMAKKVESKVDWTSPATGDDLKARFGDVVRKGSELSEHTVAEANRIADRYNQDLRLLAENYVAGLRSALEATWNSGNIEKSPLTTVLIPRQPGKVFHAGAAASKGWAVKILLYRDEFPEVYGLSAQLSTTRQQRDRDIRQLLSRQ